MQVIDKWNIMIYLDNGRYNSATAYGKEGYVNFVEMSKDKKWQIVAHESRLSEDEMNIITGYKIKPEALDKGHINSEEDLVQIGPLYLEKLVKALNGFLINSMPIDFLKRLREDLSDKV